MIEKASLFVNKVVFSDSVKVSIERALTKSPAVYPYIENLNKSFIIQAGQNCFVKESIFGTEPVQRLSVCTVRNKLFRGSTFENTPFQYQKFQLSKIEIQRGNGVPNAGTPIDTPKNTRLFYNTICALGFTRGGNGIEITDFEENHYFLVFDLTSSREAGKSLNLFPELTGAGITLKLHFSEDLTNPVELSLSVNDLVKSLLTLPVTFLKAVSSMDNFTLAKIALNCCDTSRANFSGVWLADNFGLLHCSPPQSLKKTIRKQKKFNGDASKLLVQFYFIVNTSRAGGLGKHWLLLLLVCGEQQPPVHREKQNLMFCVWDPLGKPIKSYPSFFNHLQEVLEQSKIQKVRELQIPLQSPYSNTCGLFCLYVA